MTPEMKVVVYRNFHHAWKILEEQSKKGASESSQIVKFCRSVGLTGRFSSADIHPGRRTAPFIVIEGLDGTGKTTLTKYLGDQLNMKSLCTPPKIPGFIEFRDYFDYQPEYLRRAFYSVGNYIAAQEVMSSNDPVIMDRFWHSTAAYAFANIGLAGGPKPTKKDLKWPDDLLKPDLVIYLEVSEQERCRRHRSRKAFTNTVEEQTLAGDIEFRNRLIEFYKGITGPPFLVLNVDGERADSERRILDAVLKEFPSLQNVQKAGAEGP